MTAEYGRKTYHDIEKREIAARDLVEVKNVLAPGANHCPECPQLTSKGWMPVSEMPQPGTRICLSRCKCWLVYRNPETGQTIS